MQSAKTCDSEQEMGKKKEGRKEIPVRFVSEGEAEVDKVDREAVESQDSVAQQEIVPVGGVAVQEDPENGVVIQEPGELGPAPEGGTQPEQLSAEALLSDIAELTQSLLDAREQIDALTREKSALYDQVLRRQAEFENNRKRLEREKNEYYQRTRAEVLLELLPVLDNFDRALMSLENSEGDAEALRHGVELIHKQLKNALTKLGLRPLDAVGQTFDPNLHEAVTVEETDEHKENTVIEEIERGYKLGDRLLRPAKVKVATSPER